MKQPLFSTIVALTLYLALQTTRSTAQDNQFTLSQAISTGLTNYQSIQAKRNYLNASKASDQTVKNQYLPDIPPPIQQAYGTANGQYGPIGPCAGGAGISSSGPVYLTQSWDAGF